MASEKQYEKLKAELEAIKALADSQTHEYISSKKKLYEGLCKVYLWWREASKEDGLLDRLYSEYNIQYKKVIKAEINFSPLLRYLWGMDGTINSNSIDQWNRALNKLHLAVILDKDYYKANALDKLISYISNNGGIKKLAGYQVVLIDAAKEKPPKKKKKRQSKTDDLADAKREAEHFRKGTLYFDNDAQPLAEFSTPTTIPSADSAISLALVRKVDNRYEIIGTIDDKTLIEKAVIAAYKRTSEQMPNTARLLTEIIRTQTLPTPIASMSAALADDSKYKDPTTKEVMKQLKRLLYVAKDGKFVLSTNRCECSVVTVASPHYSIFNTTDDLALAVGDRTYIENKLIHSGDFNFYSADAATLVPATQNEVASHKLQLKNTVTNAFRYVRFYPLSVFKFPPSKTQATLKTDLQYKPSYTVKLDEKWISELNGLFLSRWINAFGKQMRRDENTVIGLSLNKSNITVKYTYKAKAFKEHVLVPFSSKVTAKSTNEVLVLSKDIVPVLNALVHLEINGDVTLQADDKMLRLTFATDNADYSINVPCCTAKAKRISEYFEAYGA